MFEILFNGVLPIFTVGLLGYGFGRAGTFDIAMAGAINRFVLYVALPCLGFRLLARAPVEEFDYLLLAGFLATEIIVYAVGFAVSRYVFKADVKEAILLGLACAITNHILFVLPIAITLLGETATAPIVAIITMDIVILFIGTLIMMEFMEPDGGSLKQVANKLAKNPPVISVAGGLLFNLSGLAIPTGFDVFLGFAGNAAAPCALFSLGVVLSQPQTAGRAMLPVSLTAVKLLLHPALVWGILSLLAVTATSATIPVMMVAAAPCGTMAIVLALNYQARLDTIARVILYSSIGSLATVTIAASL